MERKLPNQEVVIDGPGYHIRVLLEGLRWSVEHEGGAVIAPSHPESGLRINDSIIKKATHSDNGANNFSFTTTNGEAGTLEFECAPHRVRARVHLDNHAGAFSLRLGPIQPAYGLGDTGGWGAAANLAQANPFEFKNDGGKCRWISPFVIFPSKGFAGVMFNDADIGVTLNSEEYVQTQRGEHDAVFDYFIGTPPEIYASFKQARLQAGYPDAPLNFTLFELGWESWDALRWNTNAASVQEILQHFIADGYPIRWAVTGSGFWQKGHTTTSFGLWDNTKYPDPKKFKEWLHQNKIHWMIGQRTNFVDLGGPHQEKGATDNHRALSLLETGPHTKEGMERGYFQKDRRGKPLVRASNVFPKGPCHLLDGRVTGAAEWFDDLFQKWAVDGIKEDTMISPAFLGIFNAPVQGLAQRGQLVMARNGFLSSPGTLLRINDTHIEEIAARIPINFLQYAACGAPNVYADPVGFGGFNSDKIGSLRMAWLTALTAGMSVSTGPWEWPELERTWLKKACDFHYAIAPYLYSAAVDGAKTGYPLTMTPLPIAYPDDPSTYDLASKGREQFEWLAGPSLLATPFARSNYKSSQKMNIYLPTGRWMDYESGEIHQGPKTLTDFDMPPGKIPCFVGGKGVLVLREGDDQPLRAFVFPVAPPTGSYAFTFPDGKSTATIESGFTDWRPLQMRVIDVTADKTVPHEIKKPQNALAFAIKPQHNYRIVSNLPQGIDKAGTDSAGSDQ